MGKQKFETFGVMVDVSRNAVMSLDGWRRFLPLLSKMGYNTVFLYAEDTYTVEGEPFFGYMRGRYSVSEMRELDALAESFGIEMIPCIQTLGHLNTLSKWNKYPVDTPDALLVGAEETYSLIDSMFATLKKCFKTNRLHVGMDEAWNLGRGKYMNIHGYVDPSEIMKEHLERVTEIAKKHGYELLIWSDMFFRPWNDNKYYIPKMEIPKRYVDALPESVYPVYWDYYSKDPSRYDDMLANHKQLSKNLWFAGGAWTWIGFVPDNEFSIAGMKGAVDMCKKHKVKNFFLTMWGDNGAECSRFSVLPTLHYIAEYARGNTDEEKIKARFKSLTGISYDDYMKIDTPNFLFLEEDRPHPRNPSKYMLYSDPFEGFLDFSVGKGGSDIYAERAADLHAVAKKSRKFGSIFESAACLCDALAVKYELGVKTREAYQAGNKSELQRLASEDYPAAVKLIGKFYTAFKKQWMLENKAFGFEVQDVRIGGIIMRLNSCKDRLMDYLAGSIDNIEELECEILAYEDRPFGQTIYYNNHTRTASSNPM